MGRDIKFRVWSKDEKIMRDVSSIYLPLNSPSDKAITFYNKQEDIYEWVYDYELMQYTGLKDENEKEIYTGDIVEINNHKYSITFEIGSFMLVRCSNETDMYIEFDNCWNDDVYPLSQFYWDSNAEENVLENCEVIGNIYENPEMLEGEKD